MVNARQAAARRAVGAAIALALVAPPGTAQRAARSQTPPAPRAWSLYTGLSNVFDSNLDHSQPGLNSYGLLVGFGGRYRQRSSGTTVELEYDGVFRRYSGTDLWDRPGHQANLSVGRRVAHGWAVGVEGEVEINGSAEDRVLRNEYSVQPEFEYRFKRSGKLQFYGEYLLKRYPTSDGRNAVDPRVGVRYRQLLGERGSWAVSGRYEFNRADSARHRYVGWTLGADFATPVGAGGAGGRFSSNVRYRIRRYTSQEVDVGAVEVLRRDHDWVWTTAWEQRVWRLWEVILGYRYETYLSNDPRREFREHLLGLTLRRWW